MDRRTEILKYSTKDQLGIEIGPWHSPIAPKREGFNSLVLDVFDAQTLRHKAEHDDLHHDLAARDPNVRRALIANIEEVDLLGSATAIADLVEQRGLTGKVDYIISSHNFEHTPDAVRFLQGCEKVLKPGGVLSMAIPDRRTCFDYFRPVSTLPDFLEAYFAKRKRPKYSQVFASEYVMAFCQENGERYTSFDLSRDPGNIRVEPLDPGCLERWQHFEANADEAYRDAHCWVFTPASFELIMTELEFLRLTRFRVLEVSQSFGNEFFAYLRNDADERRPTDYDDFHRKRQQLLHRVNDEAAENSIRCRSMEHAEGQRIRSTDVQPQPNPSPLGTITTRMRSLSQTIRAMIRQ